MKSKLLYKNDCEIKIFQINKTDFYQETPTNEICQECTIKIKF